MRVGAKLCRDKVNRGPGILIPACFNASSTMGNFVFSILFFIPSLKTKQKHVIYSFKCLSYTDFFFFFLQTMIYTKLNNKFNIV